MGRELRRVPANWEHPKDDEGNYIPLYKSFPYEKEEIEEGLRDGWLKGEPPNYGCSVMPDWPEAERTHYQLYECTTEGTPISPVLKTQSALAIWISRYYEDPPLTFAEALGWVKGMIERGGPG